MAKRDHRNGRGRNDSTNGAGGNGNGGGNGHGHDQNQTNRADGPSGSSSMLEDEGLDLLEIGPEDADDMLEFDQSPGQKATIKVIGVGGGGGNALNTMIDGGLAGVEFIAANTDAQALQHNRAALKVQLGAEVTRGLGCGANPDRGRASALEARERLRELLEGSDMVFVTAGMGGGTGTGAAPVVAEVAREIGALTVGVVTKPFSFEGKVRTKHAERGLDELHGVVDTLITIPNQRLLSLAGKSTNMQDAFALADAVCLNAVRGISDLITIHGLINLDFADVRTVMNEAGVALMGTGVGRGDARATDAAQAAISSPLLEDLRVDGARGVLINITGNSDMTLFEVNEASMLIQEAAHEDANIIFGAVIDDDVPDGELRVTVIATGLDDERQHRTPPERPTRRTDTREEFRPEQIEIEHVARSRQPDPGLSPVPSQAHGAPHGSAPQAPSPHGPSHPGAAPLHDGYEAAPPDRHDQVAADAIARADAGFDSPFEEDEYDTPAFIRKRAEHEEDDDRETPAFLRRAQD
jgi:cell division protein FtsZ